MNWERLARAETHPLRLEILEYLEYMEGQDAAAGCSPKEVSLAFGVSLNTVAYHVKALHSKGLIEQVRTEPRRGALEHFYRAVGE